MKKQFVLLMTLFYAVLFVLLFYHQYLGLNLFLFELAAITILIFVLKRIPKGMVSKTVLLGTLLSGAAVVINYSAFAIFINICSFYLYTGVLVYPEAKSVLTSAGLAITNSFQSFVVFFQSFGNLGGTSKGIRWFLKFLKIGLLPLLVLVLFVIIYKTSNPIFSKGLTSIGDFLDTYLNGFFAHFKVEWFWWFVAGLILSIIVFMSARNQTIIDTETRANDQLYRVRNNRDKLFFRLNSLKNEYKSALILLVLLNLLLLVVNLIDIYWVWFNFEWNGEYLKQFVHEGTYLLILSILISMAIVLFFFRRNLNFFPNNTSLKKLAYVWLAQNAVLAVSVGIRNLWYIHYFALAYKRIGVLFFLVLTLYGMFTIYQKVSSQKSLFYMLRTNNLAIYSLLIAMALFNWDVIIARYNFNHYKQSFVHLDFLASLSYKALPYLDKTMDELVEIKQVQDTLFPFEEHYMTIDLYHEKIEAKKEKFLLEYTEKNLLSWNLAEANAYKKLKYASK